MSSILNGYKGNYFVAMLYCGGMMEDDQEESMESLWEDFLVKKQKEKHIKILLDNEENWINKTISSNNDDFIQNNIAKFTPYAFPLIRSYFSTDITTPNCDYDIEQAWKLFLIRKGLYTND